MKTRILKALLVMSLAACLLFVFSMAVNAKESGRCGNNLTWTLNDKGTLTISGTGDMWDYDSDVNLLPGMRLSPFLRNYRIKKVIIENGVTSIGSYAFHDCSNLTSIEIPESVTSIGYYAFSWRESLETVYFSGSEDKWKMIDMGKENDLLLEAEIIFNHAPLVEEDADKKENKANADFEVPFKDSDNLIMVIVICVTVVVSLLIIGATVVTVVFVNKKKKNKQQ